MRWLFGHMWSKKNTAPRKSIKNRTNINWNKWKICRFSTFFTVILWPLHVSWHIRWHRAYMTKWKSLLVAHVIMFWKLLISVSFYSLHFVLTSLPLFPSIWLYSALKHKNPLSLIKYSSLMLSARKTFEECYGHSFRTRKRTFHHPKLYSLILITLDHIQWNPIGSMRTWLLNSIIHSRRWHNSFCIYYQ